MQLPLHRGCQIDERERLWQKYRIGNARLTFGEAILCIAGHENHPDIRTRYKRLAHPAWAVHPRHYNICYKNINLKRGIFQRAQRLFGVFSLQHGIAAHP